MASTPTRTHAHVRCFQGDTLTLLPATAFESITHALTSGAVWWEGKTLYGAETLMRCASITDVTFATEAAIAAARADDEPEWEER